MHSSTLLCYAFVACLAAASPLPPKENPPFPIIHARNDTPPSTSPTPSGSPVNQATLDLIESEEGFRADYYYINGDQTIGYGHDCTQRQDCESISPPLTEAEGQELLISDLPDYTGCVCGLPNASGLTANQYGALVSFTYNSGCGNTEDYFYDNMESSDFQGICDALPSTNTLDGLLDGRRQREADLCNTETSEASGC